MSTDRKNEASWSDAKKQWRLDVKRGDVRKSFYSSAPGRKGKLEAERKADQWLEEGSTEDMRFGALWASYLAQIDRSDSDAHYVKQEQLGRLWLLPRLESKKVSGITNRQMQECVNAPFKDKGLSKKTCKNVRAALTAAYNYARKNRIKMERPEGLSVPKGAPVKKKIIIQPDDLKTLFSDDSILHYRKKKKAHFIHAWRFIVLTGLRRGEASALLWSDVQNGVVYIEKALNSLDQTTGGKNDNTLRYIVLSPLMKRELDDQRAYLKEKGLISPWIFPTESGKADSNAIYKGWYTYRNQRGWTSSIHEMRHTMISLSKVDVPEALIKQVVGHSASMDTQGVYGHEVDGEAKRASDMIEQVFRNILDS